MAETMFEFIGATPTAPDMSGAIESANTATMYKQLMDTAKQAAELGTLVFTDIAKQNEILAKKKAVEDKAYNDLIERSRADEDNKLLTEQIKSAGSAQEAQAIYNNARQRINDGITNRTLTDKYAGTMLSHLDTHAKNIADIVVDDHEEQGGKALVTDAKVVLKAGGNVPEAIDVFSKLYNLKPATLQQTFINAYVGLISDGYDTLIGSSKTTLRQVKEYDSSIDVLKAGLSSNYFYGSKSQDMQKALTDAEALVANKKKQAIAEITNKYQKVINAYEGDGKGRNAYKGDWRKVRETVGELYYDNQEQYNNTILALKEKTDKFDEARRIDAMDDLNPYSQTLKFTNDIVKGWMQDDVSNQAMIALATGDNLGYIDLAGKFSLFLGPVTKNIGQAFWASQDPNIITQGMNTVSNIVKSQGGTNSIVQTMGDEYAQKFMTLSILDSIGIYSGKTKDGLPLTNLIDLKNAMSANEAAASKGGLSQDDYASIDNAKLGVNKQYALYTLQMAKTLTDLSPSLRDTIIEKFKTDTENPTYNVPITGKVYEVNSKVRPLVETGLNNMRQKWSDAMGVPLEDISFVAKDNKHIQLNIGGVPQSVVLDLQKYEALMQDYQRKLGDNGSTTLRGIDYTTDMVASHTREFVKAFAHPKLKDRAIEKNVTIRNFNPIAIRPSGNTTNFKGKVGEEAVGNGKFIKFASPEAGLRAAYLNVYNGSKGMTLNRYMYKFAPPKDNNNTEAYISFIEQKTGINRNTKINPSHIKSIVEAMIVHEGGGEAALNFYRPYIPKVYSITSREFK